MIGNYKKGFSTVEILVVIVIVSIISLAVVPVAEITYLRTNEELLLANLSEIRYAIASWKNDCRSALIRQTSPAALIDLHDSALYPPSLSALVSPEPNIEIKWTSSGEEQTAIFSPLPYLTVLPSDPFINGTVWNIHYASGTEVSLYVNTEPAIPEKHVGIFDVSAYPDVASRSGLLQAIDGTYYKDW